MKKTAMCDHTGQSYNQLILETLDDVILYQLADHDIETARSAQLWVDMAASPSEPINFLTHNSNSYGPTTRLVSSMLSIMRRDGYDLSINTVAEKVSSILDRKYKHMHSYIEQGNVININENGGCCYFNYKKIISYVNN